LNKLIKPAIKLIFLALISYFIWDKVDLGQIKKFLSVPYIFMAIVGGWILNILLTIFRLNCLLKLVGRRVQIWGLIESVMSSIFVGSLVPGIIGTDGAKFYFIKKLDPTIEMRQLALVLIVDRLLGLMALLFWCSLSGLILIFFFKESYGKKIFILIYLPLCAMLILLFSIRLFSFLIKKFPHFNSRNYVVKLIADGSEIFNQCISIKFFEGMFFNLMAVLILLLALVYMGVSLTLNPSIQDGAVQFFLIPLVLFSAMIPLTPFGIGVAQVTMASAYALFGLSESTGIAVSTASQIGLLFVTLLFGGVFFMRSGQKITRLRDAGDHKCKY